MRCALIDTSVYLDHWQRGLHAQLLDQVRSAFVVRQSAVVLSELRRGARSLEAQRMVEALASTATVQWAPLAADWWEAGKLVRDIGDAEDWETTRRREFQNDALIALTARRHGATVVTTNRRDFELLSRRLKVPVLAP